MKKMQEGGDKKKGGSENARAKALISSRYTGHVTVSLMKDPPLEGEHINQAKGGDPSINESPRGRKLKGKY